MPRISPVLSGFVQDRIDDSPLIDHSPLVEEYDRDVFEARGNARSLASESPQLRSERDLALRTFDSMRQALLSISTASVGNWSTRFIRSMPEEPLRALLASAKQLRPTLALGAQAAHTRDICDAIIAPVASVLKSNQVNSAGESKLAMAIVNRSVADVMQLLESGANPNQSTIHPNHPELTTYPIVLASTKLHDATPMIRALLHEGADPNAQDSKGFTVLACCAHNGHGVAARLLLEHGARIDLLSDSGKSALQIAKERGHTEIASLLDSPLKPRR